MLPSALSTRASPRPRWSRLKHSISEALGVREPVFLDRVVVQRPRPADPPRGVFAAC